MRARMLTSVFALALVAAPAAAQSEWLAAEGTSIALEFRHPSFSADEINDELGVLDGAWFLSGRVGVPLMGAAAVAELPFANSSVGDGDNSIGNVYLGVELPVMLGAATIEAGARLPTASSGDLEDVSPFLGFIASMTDRYDAFVEDAFVPRIGVKGGISATPIISIEGNLAGAYMIYTGEGDTDNDFVLDYGVRGFAGLASTRIGLGIEGFNVLTADDADADDSSINQLGLWLDHEFGMFRPGISLFLPVDEDFGDIVDYTLGVSLEVDLPL
ncbi:MAG TPA: hypothetical protein VF039_00990 [Longimicrobiales bacterium]